MRMVKIENPENFDEYVEPDMRRWWGHGCRIHRNGETLIELSNRSQTWLNESVKRLASFGVQACIVNRPESK